MRSSQSLYCSAHVFILFFRIHSTEIFSCQLILQLQYFPLVQAIYCQLCQMFRKIPRVCTTPPPAWRHSRVEKWSVMLNSWLFGSCNSRIENRPGNVEFVAFRITGELRRRSRNEEVVWLVPRLADSSFAERSLPLLVFLSRSRSAFCPTSPKNPSTIFFSL